MARRTALLLSTVVGSALTGAYWLALFALAYGPTAGDYRPGSPAEPTDLRRGITAWLIWGSGFAVYVVLAWGWRRLDFSLPAEGRGCRRACHFR